MGLKYLIPLSLLFLAGCATTGTGTAPEAEEAPVVAAEPANVPSSTATIDEHLFEPEPAEIVHDNVWDRVVHNFALPECSEHEIALTAWAWPSSATATLRCCTETS